MKSDLYFLKLRILAIWYRDIDKITQNCRFKTFANSRFPLVWTSVTIEIGDYGPEKSTGFIKFYEERFEGKNPNLQELSVLNVYHLDIASVATSATEMPAAAIIHCVLTALSGRCRNFSSRP